jgi:hypothetical protein
MTFVFNHDYNDSTQVAEWLPRFREVLAELEAAGKYRYNDAFRGRIPGIEGRDEDTAIYMLQTLEREGAQDAKVAALIRSGYEHVEHLTGVQRFAHVVLYPTRRMGGEWVEFRDCRLVPEAKPNQIAATGPVASVLPKGRRTHGHRVDGRAVLALR